MSPPFPSQLETKKPSKSRSTTIANYETYLTLAIIGGLPMYADLLWSHRGDTDGMLRGLHDPGICYLEMILVPRRDSPSPNRRA